MTDILDLSGLPVPDAVEQLDMEALREEILDDLALEDPRLSQLVPADPGYAIVTMMATREVMWRARANDDVRAGLASTSWGTNLEHHAAMEDVGEREEGESDEEYRARIFEGARARGAGVKEAYEKVAITADDRIASVLATSPSSAVVEIDWIPKPDVDPGDYAEIQAAISDLVTSESGRMIGDLASASRSIPSVFDVVATLHLHPDQDPGTASSAATEAVQAYAAAERKSRRPLPLIASKLAVPGVVKVDLVSPAALDEFADAQFHELGDITITTVKAAWL
jgi:phage-related baseplate assembly protein